MLERKMMRLRCGVIVLLIGCCWITRPSEAFQDTTFQSTCLKPCICKWKGGKESVTCHQAGFTEVPASGLEGTVQVLDLSGNPLAQLGPNQFRKLGLTHLQRVILQRCALRHIDATSFAGLTNLVELDLSHNVMSTIPSQAFQHVPELRELKLNGNPLIRLPGQPFATLSKLVRLEIANCQLNNIDQKAFHGLELLEWLRLDGNLIEVLPTASLASLRTLRGIDLHHNPWNCTCPLRPLRSWLAARNMPFSVPPLCLLPARLRGQSWNRMPLEELACPPKIHSIESLVQVNVGQPATLACRVHGNPEAVVSWFFADRLIVNLTSPTEENPPPPAAGTAAHQVYYVRESSDKTDRTDKTSQLILAAAREQDSGFYVCQASNRADRASTNITLLVKSNGADLAAGQLSRGLTAGLILAVFAMLIIVLLVCCLCSLKRARMHASLRHRRPSAVMGVPPMNGGGFGAGLFDKADNTDPFIRRQSSTSDSYKNHNGLQYKSADNLNNDDASPNPLHDMVTETRFPDKQWLVNNQPVNTSPESVKVSTGEVLIEPVIEGHRQIAMYQNKVKFNADDANQLPPPPLLPRPILKTDKVASPSASRNYPDLVDLLPDYAGSDVTSIQDEMEVIHPPKRERPAPSVFPASRYFQQHRLEDPSFPRRAAFAESGRSRRRLSDWEVNELDNDQDSFQQMDIYDSELDCGQSARRHSEDFDEDFHRRYAYHTGQLNRFLSEYRALQKRLAQMQDTWGRCLDDDESTRPVRLHHHHHPNHQVKRPLRPILKNRSSTLPRPPPTRWSPEEPVPPIEGNFESHGCYDESSCVDELYYS